jgi:two-component system chemotaxis sensor kinase CheA
VLEASGYHVRLSVDGADALRQLRQKPADLVISDIEMPNLDGFALVKALKQDGDLARIPVILVTSRSDPADRRRGLELGADAYVIKQRFDQAELLTIIDRLL